MSLQKVLNELTGADIDRGYIMEILGRVPSRTGGRGSMSLVPYHNHYNRNVGRIKRVEGNLVIASINAGHPSGGLSSFHISQCHCFKPKVDDRVLLCLDTEDGQVFLTKLRKTR